MPVLHFPRATVDRLLAHTKAAPSHEASLGDPETQRPALWLVGDEGIYLMSNGSPRLLIAGDRSLAAYARECDPFAMPSDECWDAKVDIFGADDGVYLFEAGEIEELLATYPAGA